MDCGEGMNIKWNADKYEKGFSFVHRYGEAVLDMVDLPEGSRMIDLGCGNGALTAKLAEKGYDVIGIDDSAEMLQLAEKLHPGIAFQKGDARSFDVDKKADGIFSNAVFHWIDDSDQDRMLENIYAQLVDGGELVCEFGGYGCAETVHLALERSFQNRGLNYPRVFYFPTIGEYAPRLEKAGFQVEEAFLFDRPTPQDGADGLKNWITMFCKKPFERIDESDAEDIIREAVESCRADLYHDGQWYVDYVRIRIKARKRG